MRRLIWHAPDRLAAAVLLVGFLLLASGCFPSHQQSTFDAAGPVARKQLDLFVIIFWAAALVFVAVEGALVYAVIRFRRKAGSALPKQVHGNTKLEVAWTVAPALLLAAIAVPTVATIFDTARLPAGNVLEVRVVARQWWWDFSYPELGVVTANELHIPVSTTVRLTLDSADVIHSFWVPKLAGKMDLIPNKTNTMWLAADEPGAYYGLCAEFCGTAHAQMKFKVIAQPSPEFQAWVAAQRATAVEPTLPLATTGKELFRSAGCFACHSIRGYLETGKLAPDLTHVGSRTTIAAGILSTNAEDLSEWLRNPPEAKPGAKMPNLNLSADKVEALVAYLQGLK